MELFDASEGAKQAKGVLDRATMEALYDLADDGVFDVIGGFVKEGKESKVAVAERGDELLALKLYVVEASNYEDMQQYLVGDPRFDGIASDRRSVVEAWCRKEFKNLRRARRQGVDAPEPVAFQDNVLVMEFLGEDHRPAPRLEDVELENPGTALDVILDHVEALWQGEELVHADLSPFNILVHRSRPYLIDFAQAVLESHPRAVAFLERDIDTVLQHFERRYDVVRDRDDVMARFDL